MPSHPNLLKRLLTARHWQTHDAFAAQFERAAHQLAEQDGEPRLRNLTVSRRQLDRWLRGDLDRMPRPDACRVLEFMLGRSAHELFAHGEEQPAEPATPTQMREITTIEGIRGAGPDVPNGELVAAVARQSAGHAAAVTTTGADRPDTVTVELLSEQVVKMARSYPLATPAWSFQEAVRIRNAAWTQLGVTRQRRDERELHLVAGLACCLLAAASFDLGKHDAAAEQARAAWLYGRHAGHRGLATWARGTQALVAYWSGRPLESQQLARSAQAEALEGTATMRLHSIEARAWSHLGHVQAAARSLAAAAAAGQAAGDDHLHDRVGGLFGFDEARRIRCAGSVYVRLQRPAEAISASRKALVLLGEQRQETSPDRLVTEAHADLTGAYVLRGELDGAHDALDSMMLLPHANRAEGVIRRVEFARELLAHRRGGDVEANRLDARMQDFCEGAPGRQDPLTAEGQE